MKRKRILIVDDEDSFTRLLKLNLEATGRFDVRAENWAPKAATTARDFKPDLILLDVMMADMDGGEVAAKIRSDPRMAEVQIVFLTAAVKKEEVGSRGGTIGGFPYLAKPVDTDELIAWIDARLA